MEFWGTMFSNLHKNVGQGQSESNHERTALTPSPAKRNPRKIRGARLTRSQPRSRYKSVLFIENTEGGEFPQLLTS